jgi:hypothetical protein
MVVACFMAAQRLWMPLRANPDVEKAFGLGFEEDR